MTELVRISNISMPLNTHDAAVKLERRRAARRSWTAATWILYHHSSQVFNRTPPDLSLVHKGWAGQLPLGGLSTPQEDSTTSEAVVEPLQPLTFTACAYLLLGTLPYVLGTVPERFDVPLYQGSDSVDQPARNMVISQTITTQYLVPRRRGATRPGVKVSTLASRFEVVFHVEDTPQRLVMLGTYGKRCQEGCCRYETYDSGPMKPSPANAPL